MRGGANVT